MKDYIRNIFTDGSRGGLYTTKKWLTSLVRWTNFKNEYEEGFIWGGQAHTGCAYPPKRPPSGAESNDIIFAI